METAWTKIQPEDLECIGFTDMYEEDENGEGNGCLAIWELKSLPAWCEALTASYLAASWEIHSCTHQYGDEYFDIVTVNDFNNVMEHLGLKVRLQASNQDV